MNQLELVCQLAEVDFQLSSLAHIGACNLDQSFFVQGEPPAAFANEDGRTFSICDLRELADRLDQLSAALRAGQFDTYCCEKGDLMQDAQIYVDTSWLSAQVALLLELLESIAESRREHGLNLVRGYLDRLGANIRIGEHVRTVAADGSVHISIPVLLGADFESVLAALRTGEADEI